MQHNSVNSDLRFLGNCLLSFTAAYILVSNNWGYAFFLHFLENLVILGVLPYDHITGTSIGDRISYNAFFSLMFNTFIVALFTAVLAVSSYEIISKVIPGKKVAFGLYTAIICIIVFLIATFVIMYWAILIFNNISYLEYLFAPEP